RHLPAAVGWQLAGGVGGEQVSRAFERIGGGRHAHSFSRRRRPGVDRFCPPADNSGTMRPLHRPPPSRVPEPCMRHVRAYGIAALASFAVAAAAYAQTAEPTVTPLPEAAPVEAAPLDASATEALAQAQWGDAKAGATKA